MCLTRPTGPANLRRCFKKGANYMSKIMGLFPGQGSQIVGMGREFFDASAVARELFSEADQALGYSLSELCFQGPLETLTLTENAQPAILVVSVISYQIGRIPLTAAAGHSLGEYSALVAAGALEFRDAVQLVNRRGRYMQDAVPAGEGKMVAVLGPSEDEIRSVLAEVKTGTAEIANLNSPGQTVVAGDVAGVDAFSALMQEAGGKIIPLNVSAPFHCRLMQPAAERLATDLDAVNFQAPCFPVYSNVTAEAVTTGEQARELLKRQVCGSVRWTESVQRMVGECGITHSVEFGAGGVLTKLLKRIEPKVARFEFDAPAKQAALAALSEN